ncbi:MAG TPA: SDR family oxidoreductase [Xanthobacteraceae bacterium]|nr:SDR family oxidoreductase [Xanthobacteraceae bacterium]
MATAPVLLITGGSRGLGAATARLAAKRGFDVAVNYRSDAGAAEKVVAEVKAAGRRAVAIQADVAQELEVETLFETVDATLGRLTHFVYSSGITGPVSRVESLADKDIQQVLAVNVAGAFYCTRAAIKRMSQKHGGQGGSIVLLSSMASVLGGGGEYVLYAASKGAIDSMTVGLAREVAGEGIRVNAVSPGLIDTEIQPPGRVERVGPTVPIGRAGRAEEVAEAILYLLSDAASYVAGTILRVSGGR